MMIADSVKKLMAVLHSKELRLLSGAISTLAKKSEITIHDGRNTRIASDIRKIRSDYSKIKNDK